MSTKTTTTEQEGRTHGPRQRKKDQTLKVIVEPWAYLVHPRRERPGAWEAVSAPFPVRSSSEAIAVTLTENVEDPSVLKVAFIAAPAPEPTGGPDVPPDGEPGHIGNIKLA